MKKYPKLPVRVDARYSAAKTIKWLRLLPIGGNRALSNEKLREKISADKSLCW